MTTDTETMALTAMPPYPWQAELWEKFYHSASKQQLAHALLVTGIDGVGIEQLALAMARFLLCLSPLEDIACGRCRACALIEAGSHPDLFVVKKDDNSNQIKVQQVRDCIGFTTKKAHFEANKVVLVEEIDSANVNAANALLTSLEEPSDKTFFLLTSHRPASILPTIRSRCQKMTVSAPETQEALSWLQAFLDKEHVINAKHLLLHAGGGPVKVLEWSKGSFADDQQTVYTGIGSLLEARQGSLTIAKLWSKINLDDLFQIHIHLLDSLIRAKMCGESLEGSIAFIGTYLKKVGTPLFFRLREKLQAKYALWQKNPNLNTALLIEEMALDWSTLSRLAR